MIGITQAEAVLTIELQRPERRNALNSQLVEELTQAIRKAGDGSARAIVLTGQGTAFCAGADLSGDAFAADYPDRLIELHKAMDASPMPVVGAINGPAIGAGLQLAMQCDLRVVAPDAFFQFPTSKYGLALDNWSIRRLSSLVGTDVPARCCSARKADRRDRSAHRNGESYWLFVRCPSLRREIAGCTLAISTQRCSTTTALSRKRGRPIRNSSTKPGAARMSSKRRLPGWKSGRRSSKGL
ncbi:LOW QUALITY PROTEIN: enoyl-CoA hydratase echA6, partial [Mycobacterium tuberculosis GM 1503]